MKNTLFLWVALLAICVSNAQAPAENLKQRAETEKTINGFFAAFGEKNPDKIASFVADNVDWYIFESKKFPWTGQRHKRTEIPEVFRTLFSYFVEGKDVFVLESRLIDGKEAAVFAKLGRRFKSSGKDFTMLVAIHFKVENGLITRFCLYEQTPILEKAFKKSKK